MSQCCHDKICDIKILYFVLILQKPLANLTPVNDDNDVEIITLDDGSDGSEDDSSSSSDAEGDTNERDTENVSSSSDVMESNSEDDSSKVVFKGMIGVGDESLSDSATESYAENDPINSVAENISSEHSAEDDSSNSTSDSEVEDEARDKKANDSDPKQRKNRKSPKSIQPQSGNGKSYEDFSPIMDGYGFLLDHLKPDDPDSEVDKVVKFILDKNIQVRHINILLSTAFSATNNHFYNKIKGFENLKSGRYTEGKYGEDAILLKQWSELVHSVPINDPQKFLSEVSNISSEGRGFSMKVNGAKRNVVGCFLGQGLTAVRHAADIFHHAWQLLNPSAVSGRFSAEEDAIILQEVKKTGACVETWKRICQLLNRTITLSIQKRYQRITVEKEFYVGKWNLTEQMILLETLFGGKRNSGVDEIKSFNFASKHFDALEEKLNRPKRYIWRYYNRILVPILLSQHLGTLHRPWIFDFLTYLVKNKVAGRQDINFSEVTKLFPEQNVESCHKALSNFKSRRSHEDKPLYQVIQSCLPTYNDRQDSERIQNFREQIVKIYEEAKNKT